ncbi:MAG TPA: LytTR family DNA-binding domain-containing protein [Flavisolibacter sp.]|jgi:two-component system LytT family response regulator|nr:LytTR family DNA-binding domain-containing protein [Flavisolibacter sp.]
MIPLRVVIVDDEPDAVQLLQMQLEQHCPQVTVVGTFTSSVAAVNGIRDLQPHLLFLDVEMPVMNGFELLEGLRPQASSIVFVTAYNQFALKAFKFNALDFIVKPVDTQELVQAVAKAERQAKPTTDQLSQLQKGLRGEPITKIAIPGQSGVTFIDLNDIVYAEASNNYSKIILSDGRNFLISKTLKDVQEVLEEEHFLRVHRQYIINLNHVKQLNRNEGVLTMDNGDPIPIARAQKERLVERYRWL